MTDINTPLLNIENVHVYYESSHVLQGVSLTLHEGVLGIIGRNGMGKTTLIRAIMGLVPVKSGKIWLKGRDITGLKPYQIASLGIGYVPQGRAIFPSLTVDEHLRMAAQIRNKQSNTWTPERVYELLPRLKDKARVAGGMLSGGEQQMLAIGRALVTNPSLLLMDEPSEGLAPAIIEGLVETFNHLAATGMGILIVEQNLRTAISVAHDELYVMVNGRIVQKVSGQMLLKDEQARAQLLGVAIH